MGQFNEQMKRALERLLLNKYSGIKAAPIIPGLAEGAAAVNKLREDLQPEPTPHPTIGTDDMPPAAQDMSEQEAALLASKAPAAPIAQSPAPIAHAAPAAPAIPAPTPQAPPELSLGTQYNEAARQKLYADLTAKKKEGAGYAAAAGLGDMARRMGGSTGVNAQENIMSQLNTENKTARDQFETGRKAQVEDMSTGLAMKKANREETEYKDQNDANSQQSKLAVALAQKYAPDQAKQMGWQAGKSTYADVIKVLPIMEKINAHETAKSNKNLMVGEKESQLHEKRTQQFRNDLQGSPAYKNWQTMGALKAQAEQSVKEPSPYNDLQLIYATVKALDPTSVVREGEIKLFQGTANLKNQLGGALKLAFSGQPLTTEQKQNILTLINQLETTSRSTVMQHAKPTLDQATRIGINLNEIDSVLGQPTQTQSAAPSVAPAAFTPQKQSRLAELRAKRDAGTLR